MSSPRSTPAPCGPDLATRPPTAEGPVRRALRGSAAVQRSPYRRFDGAALTLRDLLAVDRTMAANERTLLAYLRTGLGLLAAGAAILHFFDEPLHLAAGWTLLGLSAPVLGLGVWHYTRRRLALLPLVRGGLPVDAAAGDGARRQVEATPAPDPTTPGD